MARRKKYERRHFPNVEVIDTAEEGLAIGRCEDGRIIQVKGAVPGDIVDATAREKRKGMFIATVSTISKYSKDRTDPFCSHFGLCGGCKWQHMTYDAQLRFKAKRVRDAFQRIGEVDPDLIQSIVAAPDQRYYRNKLEYTASDRRWLTEKELASDEVFEREGIGFHLPGAFDKILDIEHCYLQNEVSNKIRIFIKALAKQNQWPFFQLREKSGFIRNIIVRNTTAGEVMVVLVVGEDNQKWIKLVVESLSSAIPDVVSIYSCVNTKVNDSIHDLQTTHEFGAKTLVEKLHHVQFHIGPKSFFQTNSLQAENLYALTKKLADLKPEDILYDLYCGVGSIGIYMADSCSRVVGIEHIAEAIDDAKENASLNQLTNTDFVVGTVEMILDPAFVQRHGAPDVVIADPPRAGMHPNVIKHLLAAAPKRIVYVSCNPATQARDIQMLNEKYSLMTAIPVDMFPQTQHIECVALLERK
jgi:23S rRNA (uracil1939-C5)-methyltransferase